MGALEAAKLPTSALGHLGVALIFVVAPVATSLAVYVVFR